MITAKELRMIEGHTDMKKSRKDDRNREHKRSSSREARPSSPNGKRNYESSVEGANRDLYNEYTKRPKVAYGDREERIKNINYIKQTKERRNT